MKFLLGGALLTLIGTCGLNDSNKNNYIQGDQEEVVRLMITDARFQKLQDKRAEALERGVLLKGDKDWVSAILAFKGELSRAEVRLKGDLSDHWSDEKEWSLKVRLKDGGEVLGMKRFALQRPSTRGWLNEWVLHEFLSYAGLIVLKYDFVEVSINGELLPLYAIEENFHSELIKRHGKLPGVLFKFNGDFYWRHKPGLAPAFYGAGITAFEEQKVLKNKALRGQLKKIKSSISDFRNAKVKTHEIFDCQQLAKLFVAVDIMGHHHATALDNIRFYYNPETKLIEPIGYDNQLITDVSTQGLLGANRLQDGHYTLTESTITNDYWYQYLFADSVFMGVYLEQLALMSKKEYLDTFFNSIEAAQEERLDLLVQSYPNYKFKGKDILFNNQEYIQAELDKRAALGYTSQKPIVHASDDLRKDNAWFWDGQWDELMALVDLIGWSIIRDFEMCEVSSGNQRQYEKMSYKVISPEICGSYFQIPVENTEFGLNTASSREAYRKYIETLHRLSINKESDKEYPWFEKLYSGLDDKGKAVIDHNRSFVMDYLTPYKAMHVEFVGINSPVQSIVLAVQNIHRLPMIIRSVEYDEVIVPLEEEVIIEGYVDGKPVATKRIELKVGAEMVNKIGESTYVESGFSGPVVTFSLYGTERLIRETALMY